MTNLSGTYDGVHMAIDISQTNGIEANGEEGRVEIGGAWSREAIAHADPQRSGWCCWKIIYFCDDEWMIRKLKIANVYQQKEKAEESSKCKSLKQSFEFDEKKQDFRFHNF